MSVCQPCSDEINTAVFGKPHGPSDQLTILRGLLGAAPAADPVTAPVVVEESDLDAPSDNAAGEGSKWDGLGD